MRHNNMSAAEDFGGEFGPTKATSIDNVEYTRTAVAAGPRFNQCTGPRDILTEMQIFTDPSLPNPAPWGGYTKTELDGLDGLGGHKPMQFPDPNKVDPISIQAWMNQASKHKHAYAFLEAAIKEMKDRAEQRDNIQKTSDGEKGERSMSATVRAFNALTGHKLTEAEGWEFMVLLKLVRGRQGKFRMDDYIDAAAYSALLGECMSQSGD